MLQLCYHYDKQTCLLDYNSDFNCQIFDQSEPIADRLLFCMIVVSLIYSKS